MSGVRCWTHYLLIVLWFPYFHPLDIHYIRVNINSYLNKGNITTPPLPSTTLLLQQPLQRTLQMYGTRSDKVGRGAELSIVLTRLSYCYYKPWERRWLSADDSHDWWWLTARKLPRRCSSIMMKILDCIPESFSLLISIKTLSRADRERNYNPCCSPGDQCRL